MEEEERVCRICLDRGDEPRLLPCPERGELARRLKLKPFVVSRCFSDPRAKLLRILWDTAQSLESVMRFKPIKRR